MCWKALSLPLLAVTNLLAVEVPHVAFVGRMKEVHKGEIFKICVHVRHGKIPQDKRIGLKPTAPPLIQMDTEPFILTPTTTFNCKKMSMADDNVIDDPHFYNFTIANTYISDTPMVLERPVFTLMVLRTHGVIMELTKPRIEVEEGKFGETTAVKLCFKLTDIADGLKRNVTFSLEAVPITAEENIDYKFSEANITILSSSKIGAIRCHEATVIGDDLNEKEESFKVITRIDSPDKFAANENNITVIIKKDSDSGICRRTLGELKNGLINIRGSFYRGIAEYYCNDGFSTFPRGSRYRICGRNGWVGTIPKCVPSCEPFHIENGVVQYENLADALPIYAHEHVTARVQCHSRHYIEGPSSTACKEGGWSGEKTKCSQRHCIKPPANYLVSIQVGDLTPGTVAVYNCHDHDLVGPMVVTCLESGRWNHLSYCKETANIHSVITNLHRLEFMNYLASTNVYSNQNLGPGVPLV